MRHPSSLLRSRATPVAAARVITAGLAALVVFATSAVLSPSARGEFAALQTAAVLAASVGGLSLALGISIVVGRDAAAARAGALLSVLAALVLAAVLAPLGLATAGTLGVSRTTAVVVALAAATIAGYGGLQGLAIGLGRMTRYGVADVARGVAAIVAVALALAVGTRSPAALIAVWVAGPVVGVVALARLALAPAGPRLRDAGRTALRRSLRAHPSSLAGLAVARLDIVVLAAVSSRAQVAYYSLAVVIAEAAWLLPSALAITAQADFVRLPGARAWDAAQRALGRTVGVAAVAGGLAAAGGALAVLIFLPGSYHAALVPLVIAVAGAVPYSVGHVVAPYMVTAVDRPGVVTAIAVVTLVVDVVLVLVLGGPLGALGAAIASTTAYALHAVLNVAALRRAQPA